MVGEGVNVGVAVGVGVGEFWKGNSVGVGVASTRGIMGVGMPVPMGSQGVGDGLGFNTRLISSTYPTAPWQAGSRLEETVNQSIGWLDTQACATELYRQPDPAL